ncbi:MAG: hypothetical protein RL750_865, partial [Bacteroidota bacterium]
GQVKFMLYFCIPYGPVAEWLGRALQKLLQRFESARDLYRFRVECLGEMVFQKF